LSTLYKPETRTYEQIKECLSNYYSPKPYFITERVKFNNRLQHKEGSVQQYVKEIKKLSVNCKFGDGLLERLGDRLVSGLVSSEAKRRIRMEDDNLTFDKAFEIASQVELATKDVEKSKQLEEINFVKKKKKNIHQQGRSNSSKTISNTKDFRQNRGNQQQSKKWKNYRQLNSNRNEGATTSDKCSCCGRNNHTFSECKYKTYTCKVCKKVGHLGYNCWEKVNKTNFV